MGILGSSKRWLLDKLVGAEKRRLLRRLEEVEQSLANRFARLEGLLGAEQHAIQESVSQAVAPIGTIDRVNVAMRRLLAERKLWDQLARIPNLQLQGPARSVIFLHNSYYHFFYLAQALRQRGWRAISVSLENPNGVNANYYHGEDINMYDGDPVQLQANRESLFAFAKEHFELLHFAGDGSMSFFPQYFGAEEPPDVVEWKRLGKKVAYTISGCSSATAQSSIRIWSRQPHASGMGMCDNCPWEDQPDVCSDDRNLHWGRKVQRYCDLVFSELQPSLDYLSSSEDNVVRGPVSMVLDSEFWRPDLTIPPAFRIDRKAGEVVLFHAFGNYHARGGAGRNIKGTPAILEAVQRLQVEGHPVRLLFFSNLPNETVRFYQAQADIVIDQLWAGSWGANGRESLMLGKPVVGFVNTFEHDPNDVLPAIAATPIVNATADTIYEVLKSLVQDSARRAVLGARSREFALAWHSAEAGAARYELAYDGMLARGIRMGLPEEATAT